MLLLASFLLVFVLFGVFVIDDDDEAAAANTGASLLVVEVAKK